MEEFLFLQRNLLCLDLLLPNKSNEVYNVVKELATKNGMRDNYRRLYMDGRSIAIHKYTGSSTFVVIENQKIANINYRW